MKKIAALAIALMGMMIFLPLVDARVDAKFVIRDEYGNQIYFRTPEGKIIYGNILVGQKIIFDARDSNSMYPIDRYHWDFDGDGNWDKVTKGPIVYYTYEKPGIYNVTLMAVATTAPPRGDADTVTHTVVVVGNVIPPMARFSVSLYSKNETAVTYLFNASNSYDKDGYIRYYIWDFDGDGKFEDTGTNKQIMWTYKENGYYVVTLHVTDYDRQSNKTVHVIKVAGLPNGSLNEIDGKIKIKNKCEGAINVTIILNNYEKYNLTIEKEQVINVSVSPSLNEIDVYSGGKEATFIFNGSKDITVVITPEKIYSVLPTNKTPGFGFICLITVMTFLLLRKLKNEKKSA